MGGGGAKGSHWHLSAQILKQGPIEEVEPKWVLSRFLLHKSCQGLILVETLFSGFRGPGSYVKLLAPTRKGRMSRACPHVCVCVCDFLAWDPLTKNGRGHKAYVVLISLQGSTPICEEGETYTLPSCRGRHLCCWENPCRLGSNV